MGKASGAARRGGAAAAAALALVLLGERAALAQDTTYFANHAGRSLGVPACVGNVADASCFRTDDPSPPDACIMRVRALFPAAPKQLFVPAPDTCTGPCHTGVPGDRANIRISFDSPAA